MRTNVVLFTRDLRLHDNVALATAANVADRIVPLYVHDPADHHSPHRERFLAESLANLRDSLRDRGADLLIRVGDRAATTLRVCHEVRASGIAMMEDYGQKFHRWRSRLEHGASEMGAPLRTFPGVTVVDPGELLPSSGGTHYRVFTPYWRAWEAVTWRPIAQIPGRLDIPEDIEGNDPREIWADQEVSGDFPGGEVAALDRSEKWLRTASQYSASHDDLGADGTSRLSPYLHFGCLSARALAEDEWAPDAMVRQLCWRDFYHQVLAAFPTLDTEPYRPQAHDTWDCDPELLRAWQTGNTGVDIVDAGMRQLLAQGWMHNRARLITASYLTKVEGLDWRRGAEWFDQHLLDADVANNYGNWQWVAGTGNDTKPYRRFNPRRQAERFDPVRAYRDQWLPADYQSTHE